LRVLLAAARVPEAGIRLDRVLRGHMPDLSSVVERDRRAGTERIIELGRWLILIFAAVVANFPAATTENIQSVDLVLGGWALFNLAVTLTLIARQLPGRRTGWAMTALDIAVASALVYLTGGFNSSFGLTFYAVVVASSLRYGLRGSLLCAGLVGILHLLVGYGVAGNLDRAQVNGYISRLFLYLLIALTSGLISREMVAARARQMAHTFQLEHAAFFELREVDRLKAEFIMLASHELRTPLAKIKAWLALMHEAGDRLPVEAQREGLEVLQSESEHLARLTDNLLCIAQLEAGEIRLKTMPVEVQHVVEAVALRFVETADRPRLQCAIGPDAAVILADRDRLTLVLACLVDNALKFSAETEMVLVVASRHASDVHIEVRDQGRRIPDDQLDRVFASFYQLENPLTRQRGGAGVGLYLARQLVERMGGRITIDNTRARGNSFIIVLPAEG
jgi:signal transduction histidine kinase